MFLNKEWGPRIEIKVIWIILLLVSVAAMLGGCAWVQGWFNKAPVAVISATPTSGEAPLEVFLDASKSYDPDGDEITYKWAFDDGNKAEGETVQHGFGSSGSYILRLLVTDRKGNSATSSVIISVSQPHSEITQEQSFERQDGIDYETGTGLKVSVPPASADGTLNLIVTENPVPQQPEGEFIELQSVYSITLAQESSPQAIVAADASHDSSLVTLTFDIPLSVDPRSEAVVEWTSDGWVLADNESGPPGG